MNGNASPRTSVWLILLVALLYTAVVVWVADLISRRLEDHPEAMRSAIAAADIPVGRKLQPTDVGWVDLTGYASHTIAKGAAITGADLAATPPLAGAAGTLLTLFDLDGDAAALAGVNAGSDIRLCQAAKEVMNKLKAQAVLCPTAGHCLVAVLIPADAAAPLKTATTARPADKPCG